MSELPQKGEEYRIVAFRSTSGWQDEHNPRLAATVFEFQRLEASNRAAAAVCPCGPMARAPDPNTGLRVSGTRARRRGRFADSGPCRRSGAAYGFDPLAGAYGSLLGGTH